MKRHMKYSVSSWQNSHNHMTFQLTRDFNLQDACWKYNTTERKQEVPGGQFPDTVGEGVNKGWCPTGPAVCEQTRISGRGGGQRPSWPSQHGFMKSTSCLTKQMDERSCGCRKPVDVVYMDLVKLLTPFLIAFFWRNWLPMVWVTTLFCG